MVTLYGIRNCDTVRKARKWLDTHEVAYRFHDFRTDGTDAGQFRAWVRELGDEVLINRRSPTWRKIPAEEKDDPTEEQVVRLMLKYPTVIKRPVLEHDGGVQVGFRETDYEKLLV